MIHLCGDFQRALQALSNPLLVTPGPVRQTLVDLSGGFLSSEVVRML